MWVMVGRGLMTSKQALRSSGRRRCFNPQLAVDQGQPTAWDSDSLQVQHSFKKRWKEKEISKETKYWKELFTEGSFLTGPRRLAGWLSRDSHGRSRASSVTVAPWLSHTRCRPTGYAPPSVAESQIPARTSLPPGLAGTAPAPHTILSFWNWV